MLLTKKIINDPIENSQKNSISDDECLTGQQKCFERCWKCVVDQRDIADRADFQEVLDACQESIKRKELKIGKEGSQDGNF